MLSIQNGQKGRFWRFINRKTMGKGFLGISFGGTTPSASGHPSLCKAGNGLRKWFIAASLSLSSHFLLLTLYC